MSKLTSVFLAHHLIQSFDYDLITDWAIQLLEENICTENIQIAAGLSRPVNYFEGQKYVDLVLSDLNIPSLTDEEKKIKYCGYWIEKIASGENIRGNLKKVYQYCQENDLEKNVYDFYLLYWAWDDLDYQEYNMYWDGANRNNIEDIVISVSRKWMESNSSVEKS